MRISRAYKGDISWGNQPFDDIQQAAASQVCSDREIPQSMIILMGKW